MLVLLPADRSQIIVALCTEIPERISVALPTRTASPVSPRAHRPPIPFIARIRSGSDSSRINPSACFWLYTSSRPNVANCSL
jgi:hypothetical protein